MEITIQQFDCFFSGCLTVPKAWKMVLDAGRTVNQRNSGNQTSIASHML